MVDPEYAVHPIPSVPNDRHIVRYKELRLQALQTNPESFSSTYDREFSMGHEEWKARLHSRDKVTVVAVRTSIQKSESEMLSSSNEWLGTVTVIGPNVLRQYAFSPPKSIHSVEGNENYYLFVGVWVHPNHRAKGLGKKLVEAGMDWAKADGGSDSTDKRVFLLQVSPENRSAIGLYSTMGFHPIESDGGDAGADIWMGKALA
jgi:GNAT superfamily N-acetyltransferase